MKGGFIEAGDARREDIPWGALAWFSTPRDSGAKALAVVEVCFHPGGGHDFHLHPNQEEVIYVLEGEIEQWIDRERRILSAGDCAFIAAGVVHGSFNLSGRAVRVLAILGPCVGEAGYEVVDVSGTEPWASVRKPPDTD